MPKKTAASLSLIPRCTSVYQGNAGEFYSLVELLRYDTGARTLTMEFAQKYQKKTKPLKDPTKLQTPWPAAL